MSHIRKLLKTADTKAPGVIIPELEMVEAIVTQHDDWLKRVGKLVGETKQPGLGIERLLVQTRQLLDPEDDEMPSNLNGIMDQDGIAVAVSRFNCVCRQPAKAKMYQCRKCLELYHLGCISSTYVDEPSARVIKCPFCRTKDQSGQKPQPRPSLLKFMPLLDEDAWRLGYEFEELTQIRDLVALCQHIGNLVLRPNDVQPSRREIWTDDTRFLRHWLRKLRDLPINIEIETEPANVSLYPALLSRLKQVRRARAQALVKPSDGPDRHASANATSRDQRRPSSNMPEAEAPLKITKRPTGKDAMEVARRRHRWPWFFFEEVPPPPTDKGEQPLCICDAEQRQQRQRLHRQSGASWMDWKRTCFTCDQVFHAGCVGSEWEIDIGNFGSELAERPQHWLCPRCRTNFGVSEISAGISKRCAIVTNGESMPRKI